MSNPIEQLLNKMIQNMLPKINSGIQGAITSGHLDPWGQIAHGSDTLGSINLGICDASVGASYNIGNMRGLSSFTINSLVITNVHQDGGDASKLTGTLVLKASLKSNLSAHAGGSVEAKCGFVHPHVGIGGTATVSGTTGIATGTFTASTENGNICLNTISISAMAIDYNNINVSIDGLGVFNSFLGPLTSAISNLFKGPIRNAIASAVQPIINSKVNDALPQCQSL